jgi:hypothetical protein
MFRFIQLSAKMTAVPRFGMTLTNEQTWDLAAFLHRAPGMSPRVLRSKPAPALLRQWRRSLPILDLTQFSSSPAYLF